MHQNLASSYEGKDCPLLASVICIPDASCPSQCHWHGLCTNIWDLSLAYPRVNLASLLSRPKQRSWGTKTLQEALPRLDLFPSVLPCPKPLAGPMPGSHCFKSLADVKCIFFFSFVFFPVQSLWVIAWHPLIGVPLCQLSAAASRCQLSALSTAAHLPSNCRNLLSQGKRSLCKMKVAKVQGC